jgi:hypothetical protein
MLSLLVNVPEYLIAGLSFIPFLIAVINSFNRPYVQSLTSGVKGSCQKSYSTYYEALGSYNNLKESGLVRVVRNPEDEILYGPLDEAVE